MYSWKQVVPQKGYAPWYLYAMEDGKEEMGK